MEVLTEYTSGCCQYPFTDSYRKLWNLSYN